jgi:hypothetical protein
MRTVIRTVAVLLWALWLPACGNSMWDRCTSSDDCGGNTFCCREAKCGGGMCTTGCATDRDCPNDAFCRDQKCFRACESDRDCDAPFTCRSKDGRLVCIVD